MSTQKINELYTALETAKKELLDIETVLSKLQMKAGQETAAISICGQVFPLTAISRESGYMPSPIGREELRMAAINVVKERRISKLSKVEGASHAIKLFLREIL